jgi:hypothetical protein
VLRGVVLAAALGGASGALAADDALLELSDAYFQCAAFYQGALGADMLPSGRTAPDIQARIAKATEIATGLGITARSGPRRMTRGELDSMRRKVSSKARGFSREFRADPAYARTWISEGFAFCDDKMALSG